ncbi:MAG: MoxR family ATPase [Myxococcales bacterium]|nr:MoxR family ATPase [Myxococcales bacterium]
MTDMTIKYIDVDKLQGQECTLPKLRGLREVRHHFERESLHAINAALAAERPLLIRGEPGTGKSQLARAAAFLLGRGFIWRVVDAQTQVADLFYTFDAIARLARSQVAGALLAAGKGTIGSLLDERNFVAPGPLWWAFNPKKAEDWHDRYREQSGADDEPEDPEQGSALARLRAVDFAKGAVVLIDEIDKADPSVPNGLLEALGQGTFPVPRGGTVSLDGAGPPPLIIITTNEERELPSAFLRRCLVLHIPVPKGREGFIEWLMERGRTHFIRAQTYDGEVLSEDLLRTAAEQTFEDRRAAEKECLSAPGQAEYLDLLRALARLRKTDEARLDLLKEIEDFMLVKHREVHAAKASARAAKGAKDGGPSGDPRPRRPG